MGPKQSGQGHGIGGATASPIDGGAHKQGASALDSGDKDLSDKDSGGVGPGPLGLVADIGGTNCRLALARFGSSEIHAPVSYAVAEYADLRDAIRAYLARDPSRRGLTWAVIAVAGPIENDAVNLTNHSWRIAASEISAAFSIPHVRLVNDFGALARSTPMLDGDDLIVIGGGAPQDFGGVTTTAVVGAGTGLGVGGLIITADRALPLTTEGGHATFAPTDDLEREINRVLLKRFERVSAERLLCGEGLVNIRAALAEIEGVAAESLQPRDVTARAIAKSDPLSVRTMQVFSRAMGAFAGDVALIMGARGGVYVGGGLIPATLEVFDHSAFRERFEAKGRFQSYMEQTPTRIVAHPYAALIGAAALGDDLIAAAARAGSAG